MTAFIIRRGLFESLVICFGSVNDLSQFHIYVNYVSRDIFDKFVLHHIDDLLIRSENLEVHRAYMEDVICPFYKPRLQIAIDKYELQITCIESLNPIVIFNGIEIDPEIIMTVKKGKHLANLKDLHGFQGFEKLYRRLIRN